jgi:calcineurin-like phosphoesterase family protein
VRVHGRHRGVQIALPAAVPISIRAALVGLGLLGVVACHRQPPPREAAVVRAIAVDELSTGALALPNRATSVKFAVIGDSGRGTKPQYDIAGQMAAFRERFRFPFVLMLGDNLYEGPARPDDYREKFEEPYRHLLDEGVKFYASLGNHDDPREVDYAPFHMHGQRYYSFSPPEDLLAKIATRVEFFAIDSNHLDRAQLRWLDERLATSHADWKVCFFHHPLHTSGRYRASSMWYRFQLEPVLVSRGVDVVFSGHEHFYERTQLEEGIQYFISGGAGSLRSGDAAAASDVARTFDRDYHFMLIEIDGDELYFQAITRTGRTIDAGTLRKRSA